MSTIGSTSAATSSSGTNSIAGNQGLKSEDFMKLLITQLKNQDPTKPMTNQELLGQVTQIGTLQSQNALQDSMQDMTLQNQISSASGMIGKSVTGQDDNGAEHSGTVTSIKVVDKAVTLELDDGSTLQLNHITKVAEHTNATVGPQLPNVDNPGIGGGFMSA